MMGRISERLSQMFGDPWLAVSSLIVLAGLGGFLLWATFAPLAEGVTGFGQIIVEDNKKTVQHLEGGIISDIRVEEGQFVHEGDVLFLIDAIAVTANRDQIAQERATNLATQDRLTALLSDAGELVFTTRNIWNVDDAAAIEIEQQQQDLFREQAESYASRVGLMETRKAGLEMSAEQREAEIAAVQASVKAIEVELEMKEQLVEEQLARLDELQRLRREYAGLLSQIAALQARRQESAAQSLEIESGISQVRAEFREKLSTELLEAKTIIAKADEQLKSMQDAVRRTQVIAPTSGQVLNLQFATIGGVVRPGEPMLEIVPPTSGLWATIQVQPGDREMVREGLKVNARLSGFKSWKAPTLKGTVTTVSGDLKKVPETGASYYEARILIDEQSADMNKFGLISPGMPVEAFVDSGRSRTLLDYLIEPVYAHFARGLSNG